MKNQERIGKHIAFISRIQTSYIGKLLEPLGLGKGTYPILLGIAHHKIISQNSLARAIQLDKAMVARNTKKLVELGYVKREKSSENKSLYNLSLTEKGHEVIPKIKDAVKKWDDYISQDIEDVDEFKLMLKGVEARARELSEEL